MIKPSIISRLENANLNKKHQMYTLPFLYDYAFPTFLVPNAMRPEFVVTNYFHSQHSNRNRDNEVFCSNQTISLTNILFENSIGTWPACWNAGSQLESGAYTRFLKVKKQSLYLGKKDYQKYIYPVSVTPYLNDFVGDQHPGRKLNQDTFWKYMSQEALIDAQQGKALIVLDFAQENEFPKSSYIKLHESLALSGIPANQIILVFNSFNAAELYKQWFSEDERRLEVINLPYLLANSSYHIDQNPTAKIMSMDDFISSKNRIRDNYYLFKIRRARDHRLALLAKMHDTDLLDKGDWSCLEKRFSDDVNYIEYLCNKFEFIINKNNISNLISQIPKTLKSESNRNFYTAGGWEDNADNYKNSYFYIATETFMDTEYKSLTEKIFKPITNFQPFIFASWPGSLQLLRDLGFKTFPSHIDESYDTELDSAKRLEKIYNEILRLTSMSKQELHDWYWSAEEILLHNHEHMRKYHRSDTHAESLIKYLHHRINS